VRIELSIAAPTTLQRNVLERRLHLAIASFPVEVSALSSEPLYDETNSFYCGAGHPLFGKADVAIEDIQAGRIVARSYWRGADLSRIGVEREAAAVEIMEAQATLILSGSYLGFLPEHYAAPWVAEGRLRRLLPERLSYVSPFSMIVRRPVAEQQVVRQFIEDLRASLPATRVPQIGARMSTRQRNGRAARAKPRPVDAVAARN
jgi:DNA-binding transcriptional LysR family regulator